MSTITSPHHFNPSTSLPSSPSTSRPSSPAPGPARRPNRAALRDYYGIQNARPNAIPSDTPPGQHSDTPTDKRSELDAEGFDAEAYVKSVLAGEGLEGILRVEGGLINEIRGLDGERKALVYDNYSKLISATDTIRNMRNNMDPLTPTTSTLSPAVAHIAETAGSLVVSAQERQLKKEGNSTGLEDRGSKRKRRNTVEWVLATPTRLSALLEKGFKEQAESDWREVRMLLEKWEGIPGVADLRSDCERIVNRS